MPSTTSSSVSAVSASSPVITPSLPTFCIASAIILPIDLSPFEAMVPIWPILDVLDHRGHRNVDAALEIHRVHAGGDKFEPFLHDRGRKHRSGRGAVAGEVRGLGGNLAKHLRAHVLELVFEFDLLGDGHAVLGDPRRAVRLVENDVAALRTERHLDGV